ncbi:MAG: hypothetical protein H6744_11110 [Deltaproteobacteria bacterium]|nr:hypothetical protein [Deltaproteobacteria bacterium]MCB9787229.1 hypothetical protein [Deltaproteobacteria bacterium]
MEQPLTPAEADALVRHRAGDPRGHIEGLTLEVDLGGGRALWLGHTLWTPTLSGRQPQVIVSAVAFGLGPGGDHVALRRAMPAGQALAEGEAFYLRAGEVELRQGRATGCLEDAGGGPSLRWELDFSCDHEGFRHLPAGWMYGDGMPWGKWTTPQPDSRASGRVWVGGEEHPVSEAPARLGHRWGPRQPEAWRALRCNGFVGAPGVVVEALVARQRAGRLAWPPLRVLHVRIPGERITMGPLGGRWTLAPEPDGLGVRLDVRSGDRRVECAFAAGTERFVGLDQADPDGRIAHRLHTGVADAALRVYAREAGAWRETFAAHAEASASLELGTRGDTHGVRIRIR